MDDFGNLLHVQLEDAERVGVGQHHPGRSGVDRFFKGGDVHRAAVVGWDGDDVEARQRGAGRVRSVGRVRDDDGLLLPVAAVAVIGGHEHAAGQFAMGAGQRLEGELRHAGDFREQALHLVEQSERPLRELSPAAQLRPERMDTGKARQAGHLFASLGIVFHRAGAKRVEVRVNGIVQAREPGEMAHDLRFRQLGNGGRIAAQQLGVDEPPRRQRLARETRRTAAGGTFLEYELHDFKRRHKGTKAQRHIVKEKKDKALVPPACECASS